jgi:hypothetical protein
MSRRDEDKTALLNMKNGHNELVNWFEESGGEVYLVNYDWFVLFEVTSSGKDSYANTYHRNDIDKLLDVAYSWT